MLSDTIQLALVPDLIRIAAEAAEAILEVYESDEQELERKADASPLTLADRRAHEIIESALTSLDPSVPLLSEEGAHTPWGERSQWEELWLVDPLDGTKEFLKHNGEFTVNIALVQRGEPVLGIILAPVTRDLWAGIAGHGAWKIPGESFPSSTDSIPHAWRELATQIHVRERSPEQISIIASRSHYGEKTRSVIDRVSAAFSSVEMVHVGSSLKLCAIAEGTADFYPRYAPTSEWDTAAGHAIVRAAGGEIYQAAADGELPLDTAREAETGAPAGTLHPDFEQFGHSPRPLCYNKEDLLNPWFVVRSW